MRAALNQIELRMYNSLLRARNRNLKKQWLIAKSGKTVTILEGRKRTNSYSGRVTISFQYKHLGNPDRPYDPLEG